MNTDKIYAQNIANEYAPKKASKVVALKKLDRAAKKPAEIFAFTFGIILTLVFGTGMCLAMGVIGGATTTSFIMGIIVGVIGIIGIGINYPIYKKILAHGKMKYGSDIIRLASEIAEEEQGSKMNKNETKYLNTARLMNEALIILLEKKNYEFIRLKEI